MLNFLYFAFLFMSNLCLVHFSGILKAMYMSYFLQDCVFNHVYLLMSHMILLNDWRRPAINMKTMAIMYCKCLILLFFFVLHIVTIYFCGRCCQ